MSPVLSTEPTRKTFLKLLGLAVGAGLAGRFFRRPAAVRSPALLPAAPRLSTDPRVVVRRADTV